MFLMWVSLAWGIITVIGIVILLPAFGLPGTAAAVAASRIGFAMSLVLATSREGLGPRMLATNVTTRAVAALAVGISAVIAVCLAAWPDPVAPWQLTALFLVAYLLVNLFAARLQARRRAA